MNGWRRREPGHTRPGGQTGSHCCTESAAAGDRAAHRSLLPAQRKAEVGERSDRPHHPAPHGAEERGAAGTGLIPSSIHQAQGKAPGDSPGSWPALCGFLFLLSLAPAVRCSRWSPEKAGAGKAAPARCREDKGAGGAWTWPHLPPQHSCFWLRSIWRSRDMKDSWHSLKYKGFRSFKPKQPPPAKFKLRSFGPGTVA